MKVHPAIESACKVLDGAALTRQEALAIAQNVHGSDLPDLISLANKVRNKFDVRGIWLINRIIGSVVMLVSVLILLHTVRDYFKFVI